jgi:glycosyltransferase involved in cell wall biosynthesis
MNATDRWPDVGRLILLNENLGGHATMHLNIYRALAEHPEIDRVALDVPARSLARRVVGLRVPGLSRLDLDLASIRAQLALSTTAHNMLKAALATGPVGAIHAYSQHAALRSTAELAAYPSVVSTDGSAAQNAVQLPFRRPGRFTPFAARVGEQFEARVFDAATIVVAQSEWCASAIRDRYGLGPDRLRVIPFGIIPPDPVPERPHDPDALPEITFTGNSMDRKGGWTLLRAFRSRLRGRCVLNLVTPEPVPPEPGVRVFSDFTPGDPRLIAMLARSAVFALPSEIDKSPYSVLEAMFAGLPVVSTPVGGIPEMVLDGETGLLVAPHDDVAIAEALERLLGDDALRARMGGAARARAHERFDARKTTAELIRVIAEAEAVHAERARDVSPRRFRAGPRPPRAGEGS